MTPNQNEETAHSIAERMVEAQEQCTALLPDLFPAGVMVDAVVVAKAHIELHAVCELLVLSLDKPAATTAATELIRLLIDPDNKFKADRRQEVIDRIKALVVKEYHGDFFAAFLSFAPNGRLTHGKLVVVLERAGVGSRFTRSFYASSIIDEVDTNLDGEIDAQEFKTVLDIK